MEFQTIEQEITYYNLQHSIQRELEEIFVDRGYTMFESPFFEDYDEFIYIGERTRKESMVKVLNATGDILILRPDITNSIIKKMISRWEKHLELKIFYCSTVFEYGDLTIDEHKQFGIEYLGGDVHKANCEIINLALKTLNNYKKNYILEISTSKYLNSLLEQMDLESRIEKHLKILINSKNRYELNSFVQTLSLETEVEELFYNLLDFQGSFDEVIEKAKDNYINGCMLDSLKELEIIRDYMVINEDIENVYFDLSMLADFDYYDGVIFKGYYPNVYRPILKGGRYDCLTESLGDRIAAIGFSIDMNELVKELYKEEV